MREGEKRGKGKSRSDRVRGTRPSHRLEEYAGTYRHPGYGPIRIDVAYPVLKGKYDQTQYINFSGGATF